MALVLSGESEFDRDSVPGEVIGSAVRGRHLLGGVLEQATELSHEVGVVGTSGHTVKTVKEDLAVSGRNGVGPRCLIGDWAELVLVHPDEADRDVAADVGDVDERGGPEDGAVFPEARVLLEAVQNRVLGEVHRDLDGQFLQALGLLNRRQQAASVAVSADEGAENRHLLSLPVGPEEGPDVKGPECPVELGQACRVEARVEEIRLGYHAGGHGNQLGNVAVGAGNSREAVEDVLSALGVADDSRLLAVAVQLGLPLDVGEHGGDVSRRDVRVVEVPIGLAVELGAEGGVALGELGAALIGEPDVIAFQGQLGTDGKRVCVGATEPGKAVGSEAVQQHDRPVQALVGQGSR